MTSDEVFAAMNKMPEDEMNGVHFVIKALQSGISIEQMNALYERVYSERFDRIIEHIRQRQAWCADPSNPRGIFG